MTGPAWISGRYIYASRYSLSEDRRKILHGIIDLLESESKVLVKAGGMSGSEAFGLIRRDFNARRAEHMERVKEAGSELDKMFSFAEKAFAEGQEMLIILTELTKGAYSAYFISRHGCSGYYQHNKELMFYERQNEIEEIIAELDL